MAQTPAKRDPSPVVMSKKKRKIFLKELALNGGRVTEAAKAAGYVDSSMMRALRKRDAAFGKAWDEALEAAVDVLESEATRRAVDGTREPVYYRGNLVGWKLNYSDRLLEFLLRANNPNKFNRDTRTEIELNANFGIAVIPAVVKNAEDWERSAQMAHGNQKPIDLGSDEYEVVSDADRTVGARDNVTMRR